MSEEKEAHVKFYGRVQGVCFRAYTQRQAQKNQIGGWVKNLRDGSVEAVFEGDRDAIERVIDWLETKHPHASVSNYDIEWSDAADKYEDFHIRY